ncbi:cleavage and polyadenylation specificity factor subunit 6-like [Mesocricetus auratus]|uniref:Cleavage and polyadenylation specificity factor subunit 6-like n=1 Tax=Mesocricetus auratus TaxID=10036 RepID=A0ABM2X2M1_MESAU|nr:cleavage and polyadenylation specificity factor subunit 6-like [Mesocricetus auratus]
MVPSSRGMGSEVESFLLSPQAPGAFSLPFYSPQPQRIKCTVGVALSSPPLFRAVFVPLLRLSSISLVQATELSGRGRWCGGPRAFGGGGAGIKRLMGFNFNPRFLPGVHRVGNEAEAIGPRVGKPTSGATNTRPPASARPPTARPGRQAPGAPAPTEGVSALREGPPGRPIREPLPTRGRPPPGAAPRAARGEQIKTTRDPALPGAWSTARPKTAKRSRSRPHAASTRETRAQHPGPCSCELALGGRVRQPPCHAPSVRLPERWPAGMMDRADRATRRRRRERRGALLLESEECSLPDRLAFTRQI